MIVLSAINASSLYTSLNWLKQQWNRNYERVRLALTDELIVYNSEGYFPKEVRKILQKDKEFLQAIKLLKKNIKEYANMPKHN